MPRLERSERILILTPVKDAARHLDAYFDNLRSLDYPHRQLSIALLESDSDDNTWADLERRSALARKHFRRVRIWKKDFGYRIPEGLERWADQIQTIRRSVLARSRNHLLFHALDDEDWVLWIDVDVVEYPRDVLRQLLATGRSIVHPHCVLEYGGRTCDLNAWRQKGQLHMQELRAEGELVKLDAVGGTMLLVRADLHRDGLVFPSALYGRQNALARTAGGEIETEGFGLLAHDMGHQCWGMPHLEVRHADPPNARRPARKGKQL
jgi:hypothetical protein